MRFASAVSSRVEAERAVEEVARKARDQLGSAVCQLVVAFVTQPLSDRAGAVIESLRAAFPDATLLASSAHSAIGAGRELEGESALAIVAGALPDCDLRPFALPSDRPDRTDNLARGFEEAGIDPSSARGFLLLIHPNSAGVESLLGEFAEVSCDAPVAGGIASGEGGLESMWVSVDDEVRRGGCVGVAVGGPVGMDLLVAQGCRPVGTPSFATRTEGNAILELDGRPPLEVLQEVFDAADPRERRLLQSALFIGLGMAEGESRYGRGDFLVRNLMGVHEESGALVLPSVPPPRSVVQFHVRDAESAAADLEQQAEALRARAPDARGALLFSCLGRGRGLYGVANHDTDLLARFFPSVPAAGFFCNGEIGPVGGRTYLHNYTSVYTVFRPAEPLA